ncbi:pirin family protein [Rouxiella sp. Mn2063]|uniref:pirin family protein n=1 Tax=Rouxiella sp. Mn2063 TaxID=3395262 RepID=UPI003BDAB1E0
MKKVLEIYHAPRGHWVGDGFPVRSLFSYDRSAEALSPFLLLDYAGPANFTPTDTRRGVGIHPHRGFETVTIVYKGEVEHHDSTGQGGVIGPGDVQWMTAGSGILHEEFHSHSFAQTGGELEMVQLWVNLPAKDKMTQPGYQAITSAEIPSVTLSNHSGELRVIAGEFASIKGPASTFSPLNVWDFHLNEDGLCNVALPDGWTAALVVLRGEIEINGQNIVGEAQMALLDREGSDVSIKATQESVVLLLSGEPINEPVVGHGPFVMNSTQEISQAFSDFKSGKFTRSQS